MQCFLFQVDISQIVVHEAYEPNRVVDLLAADDLAGEDLAEIDFPAVATDAPAWGHRDGLVMAGIIDVRRAGVAAR